MNKSKHYFLILAIAIITIIVGYALNIPEIKNTTHAVMINSGNIWILIPAIISAFILQNYRHYWLTIAVIALIDALCIHFFIVNGSLSGLSGYTIFIRIFAFATIVYLLNLLRILIKKI